MASEPFDKIKQREYGSSHIIRNRRIDRYWTNKETDVWVEVRKLYCIDGRWYKVIYFDPIVKHELSLPLKEFQERFKAMGNTSSKF